MLRDAVVNVSCTATTCGLQYCRFTRQEWANACYRYIIYLYEIDISSYSILGGISVTLIEVVMKINADFG
jgi:hypothetical protein